MKILKIRLQNLNSLRGTHELDFTAPPLADTGLFAITGQTGAGKSTILDAITLALYGRTSRDHAGDIMSYGEREAYGMVEIEKDDHRYRAKFHQKLTRTGNLKEHWEFAQYDRKTDQWPILETKKSKLKSTKDRPGIIEEHIGLSYEQFLRSVILAQGDFAAFLKADSSERAKLLERITGTEIYTQLSIAAHERHREEKDKIKALEARVNAIELLSEEELAELHQRIEAQRTTIETETQRHEQLRKFQEYFRKLDQTRRQLDELTQQRTRLETRRVYFEQLNRQLQADLATRPFADLLITRQEQRRQMNSATEAVHRVQERLPLLRDRLKERQTDLDNARRKMETARKEEEVQLPKLREAERLDDQLKSVREILADFQQDAVKLKTKTKENRAKEREVAFEISQVVTRREQADKFFAENSRVEELPRSLRLARPDIQGYDTATGLLLQREQDLEKLEQEIAELKKKIGSGRQQLDGVKPALEKKYTEFSEITGRPGRTDTSDVLRSLEQELEQGRKQQQIAAERERDRQQLEQQQTTLAEKRDEVAEMRVLLDRLQTQRDDNERDRIEVERQLEELRPAKRIEDLEQEIETLRSQLTDGAPCPVCGATDHRTEEVHTKKQTSVAEQFGKLEVELSQLRDTGIQISTDIGTHRKQLDKLEEQATAEELELVRLRKIFESDYPTPETAISVDLTRLEKQRNQAAELDRDIRRQEQQVDRIEQSLQLDAAQLTIRTDRKTELQQQIKDYLSTITTHQKVLHHQLGMFGFNDFKDLEYLEKLSDRSEQMTRYKQEAEGRERELRLRQENLREIIENLKKEEKIIQEKILKEENKFKEFSTQRADLIGDADIADVRTTLQKQRMSTEEALEKARLEFDRQRSEIAKGETEQKTLQNQLETTTGLLSKTERQLHLILDDSEFDTIEAVQTAQLSSPDRERLQSETQNFTKEQTALNTRLNDQQQELTRLQTNAPTEVSEEKTIELLEQQSKHLDELKDALGGWKNQLTDHERKVAQNKQLNETYRKQKRELDRWTRLHDLIGSGDGKKFRVFAQGLTLNNLLRLANRQLTLLDPRYRIRNKPGGENLDLEIIDTYQADNTRSTNTLSGGETFLVSLALALGLSDLAGRNTRIESLFIDEGFGTLDGQTLDSVITTLENLQSSGKTIGIISHVSELKERIGTQVRVVRGADGFSEVMVR